MCIPEPESLIAHIITAIPTAEREKKVGRHHPFQSCAITALHGSTEGREECGPGSFGRHLHLGVRATGHAAVVLSMARLRNEESGHQDEDAWKFHTYPKQSHLTPQQIVTGGNAFFKLVEFRVRPQLIVLAMTSRYPLLFHVCDDG